ncbi:MAG: hypothetical protein ACYCZ0_05000 [Minisyncoccota bacterium]
MHKTITYLSWIALMLAIVAWGGVVYGSLWLRDEAKVRGASVQSAEQKTAQAAYASRLKSLARETETDRANLETLSRSEIVSVANAIEAAGRSIGVAAKVNAAIPAGNPKDIPGGAPLSSVAFIVQGEGSFSGVVQLVRVLEKFPGFSRVEQFEFERAQSIEGAKQPWRTTIRLRIYTTADIAS